MSSKFLDFIFGYEDSENKFLESTPVKLGKHFASKIIGGAGSIRAKAIINHPVTRFFSHFYKIIACLPIKSYGVASLFFGLCTLLMNFAEYYFKRTDESPAFALIVGAVFTVISIPLLCTERPLVQFLRKYKFTDMLFFEVLCLHRIRKSDVVKINFKWAPPIIIGTAASVIGFLLPLGAVLITMLSFAVFCLAISSPEFIFIAIMFFTPIFPILPHTTAILTASVALMSVSFAIKVILGKRQFHFEQYDFIIIAFMLFTLISGIFLGGINSFVTSLTLIALMTTYFSVSNILVNRRIADNAVNILILSSVPTAIYAIIDYFISPSYHPEWLDPSFEGGISARAVGTFGNPNIYAVYLLVVIIFAAVFIFDGSLSKKRFLYLLPTGLNIFVLVLTWTRGAWLALIISAAAFAVIRSRRCTKLLLIPILVIPLVLLLLPTTVMQRLLSAFDLSDTSVSSRLSVLRSSLKMFADNIFTGVGIGEDAFTEEFLKYAEDSVTAPHSHNLFLEIGCEAGIFALLLFLYLLIVRIRHRASYAKYVRNSSVDSLCTMSGTAIFSLLCFGMTDYIWYNPVMFVLFFTVFAMGSATLRISKNEHDEAHLADTDEDSETAAEVNISLSGA